MRRARSHLALLAILIVLAAACTSTEPADETTAPTAAITSSTGTTAIVPPPPPTTSALPSTSTTSTAAAEAPAFEPGTCRFDVPEGRTVECGWLEVPADRTDPAAATIRLHVARFASENPSPAPDPVVYLEGGPGGDSLELVPILFEASFAHLLADRDVIFFDQRGTGYSEPSLACPELRELGFEMIEMDLSADEALRRQLDTITGCRDRLLAEGADLDAYSSAASAADLADLRRALGIDEWNLYGISYGTRLALTTMRDQPEGIRSVVLDSTYPPEVDILAETPANLDRALRELFDGCAADEACAAAYPNLESTFYRLVRDLDGTALRAPVTDVFTGDVYDAVFSGGSFGSIVFQSLYSEEAIRLLPLLIDHVSSGDTYELSLVTSSFAANSEFVSIGMQLSVQCNEEAAFSTPEAVQAALEQLPELTTVFAGSPNLGSGLFDVCELWGAGRAPSLENEPIRSSIPTLVLAGEYDPITPPAWGRQAAANLDQSTFVEFPGLGHGPSAASGCAQEIVRGFLAEPGAQVDVSCAAELGPPDFVTPDTPVPDVRLVAFGEETPPIAGVVPEDWERQDAGIWARASNSFDQAVLVQQFAPIASPGLLLGLVGDQFGLGDDPQPVGEYDSPAGPWSLYEGVLVGAPTSVALAELDAGTALVILVSPPNERDQLRRDVFFPALDAFSVG